MIALASPDPYALCLYNNDAISYFDSNNSEYKIIEAGIHYYKSVKTENQTIKENFFYPEPNNEKWDKFDVYGTSMIITNATLDFIIFEDSFREEFYFYGDSDFLNSIFPISFENYRSYYEKIIENTYSLLYKEYFGWLWKNYIGGTVV